MVAMTVPKAVTCQHGAECAGGFCCEGRIARARGEGQRGARGRHGVVARTKQWGRQGSRVPRGSHAHSRPPPCR